MLHPRTCIECGNEGQPVGGARIYPHRPDLAHKTFILCECGAYVGCHPHTTNPLGSPCGPETRNARKAAHAAFDPLWRNKPNERGRAYKWLASALGEREVHIGWMDRETAYRVVALCKERANALP